MLVSLVEQALRQKQRLEEYLAGLLEQVSKDLCDSIGHEYELDSKVLHEHHAKPLLETYIDREFMNEGPRVYCRGKFKDGQACTHKPLPNGFCKMHADQYTEFAARQKALKDFLRVRQKNPSHTHPPCQYLVTECPMCDILKRQGNPFFENPATATALDIPWTL